MAGEIAATFDGDRFERAIAMGPRFYRALIKHVGKYLDVWVRKEMRGKQLSGRPGLIRRTGTLSRSFASVHHGNTVNSLRFVTGTQREVPYAQIHETGGTIRPTRAKFLTIPLDAAKTPAGVLRARAPFWDNTFFMRSKAGNLFIMQRHGGEVRALFLLKKEVYVPPRLGFYAAFDRQRSRLIEQFGKAVDEALNPEPRAA